MSTILFILEYAPLAMPKASYPSMESILIPILRYIKTSFSACTLTGLTTVHYLPWNCTPILFPRIQSCLPLRSETQMASLIRTFSNFECNFNRNWSDNVKFDHLSGRTLCAMPHIGCQFMSWYFNVHAQGVANLQVRNWQFGL